MGAIVINRDQGTGEKAEAALKEGKRQNPSGAGRNCRAEKRGENKRDRWRHGKKKKFVTQAQS